MASVHDYYDKKKKKSASSGSSSKVVGGVLQPRSSGSSSGNKKTTNVMQPRNSGDSSDNTQKKSSESVPPASTSDFYRDQNGNVVNASGSIVMTASTVSKLNPETQQKVAKFPSYEQSRQQGSGGQSGGGQSGGTPTGKYSLIGPDGKVINPNYSAADKADMERMGLASGYRFEPTMSGGASNDSPVNVPYTGPQTEDNYNPNLDTQFTEPEVEQETFNEQAVEPVQLDSNGEPYFLGDYGIVQYGGAYWFVDNESKTLRPFESVAAFNNLTDPEDRNVPQVDASAFEDGKLLDGYERLSSDFAIKFDGSYKTYEPSKIRARYGNSSIDVTSEQEAWMVLDGFLDLVATQDETISAATLDKIRTDKTLVAKYLNALAYGGYTLEDVYRDFARRELIGQGKTEYNNIDPISAEMNRIQYQTTQSSKDAYNDPQLAPPVELAGINRATLNLPLYNLPDEVFKTLVPILDYNSPEMKEAMNEIESIYHDILMQQLEASTEQQKAVADYNWDTFREELEKNYGIRLSNNALDAWDQITNMKNEYSGRGISGSGLEQENIDAYLSRVRRSDNLLRQEKLSEKEKQEANYFLQYASQQEIADLVNSNPEKAKNWGLIPSDDVRSALSFETLRAKYPPEVTDKEINDYINSVIDENGNYRSELYQNYTQNALNIQKDKETYQMGQALDKKLLEEQKAYADYTQPDVDFLRYTPEGTTGSSNIKDLDLPSYESVAGQESTGDITNPLREALNKNRSAGDRPSGSTGVTGGLTPVPASQAKAGDLKSVNGANKTYWSSQQLSRYNGRTEPSDTVKSAIPKTLKTPSADTGTTGGATATKVRFPSGTTGTLNLTSQQKAKLSGQGYSFL